jgi:hypothetical protein
MQNVKKASTKCNSVSVMQQQQLARQRYEQLALAPCNNNGKSNGNGKSKS